MLGLLTDRGAGQSRDSLYRAIYAELVLRYSLLELSKKHATAAALPLCTADVLGFL
jgi:hypothetical protein